MAAQLSTRGLDEIQRILFDAVDSKRTSGLIFGATNVERELGFACAGPQTFGDPSSEPITEDSIIWLCSLSKIFAAIAAYQLIEAGKLSLDTIVADILPELADPIVVEASQLGPPNLRPAKCPITVKHLLNHSSGLDYGYTADQMPALYSTQHDKLDPIKKFLGYRKGLYPTQPLTSEPGSSFAYGYSSDVLGFLVEKVTGESLEVYYKNNIFAPLGIHTASFYLTPDLKAKAVTLSYREEDGSVVPWDDQTPITPQDPKKVHLHVAGGFFYMTMKDYLAVLRHLLQIKAGTAANPILTLTSVNKFFEPTLTPLGVEQLHHYLKSTGMQWSMASCLTTEDIPGQRRKGSLWWWGWSGAFNIIDPETGVALVFASQLVPFPDHEIRRICQVVEQVFYRNITVPKRHKESLGHSTDELVCGSTSARSKL